MRYCSNCGNQLDDSAKFCPACGHPVRSAEHSERQEFNGKVLKCPNCGEPLHSFETFCPACGYEIRSVKAAESISNLGEKLEKARTSREKADIIRHFPIPNTREDILEFLILASTNLDGQTDSEISSAWGVKLEQVMQKARILIQDEKELEKIEKQYQNVTKKLTREKTIRSVKSGMNSVMPVLPQVIAVALWLVSIFLLIPLCGGASYHAFGFCLLIMLDFILGAKFIPLTFRNKSVLPRLVASAGIVLSVVFLILLWRRDSDSGKTFGYFMALFVEAICSIVIFVKTSKYDKKNSNRVTSPNGASLLTCLICAGLFVMIGAVTVYNNPVLPSSGGGKITIPAVSEDSVTDASQGIYTYTIRNYVGRNLASIGKISGDYLVDEYGDGDLKIMIETKDGTIVPIKDNDSKKQYTVVGQNIDAGTKLILVNKRDSIGKPYSNLVDYQSYDEIVLFAADADDGSYSPKFTEVLPTLDKHQYHIRDYEGRNAASFEKEGNSDYIDEYGHGKIKITFSSADGSYVNAEDVNELKNYVVSGQDIAPNTELDFVYETNSMGIEYDSLIDSQNYDEINLTLTRLDSSVTEKTPVLEDTDNSDDF